VLAAIPTAVPLPVALAGVIGIGIVGLLLTAALAGLALGAQPVRLAGGSELPEREALRLGAAAGFFAAAITAGAGWLRTPAWARFPDLNPLGSAIPTLQVMIDPLPGLLSRTAVILATAITIDRLMSAGSHRRALAVAAIVVIGFLAAGAPPGLSMRGWSMASLVTAAGFAVVYLTLLRYDLTMVPVALGTMAMVAALARGMEGAFPGVLIGSIVAAFLSVAIAWWWFRALRQARTVIATHTASVV
jgi:hypothetical protein